MKNLLKTLLLMTVTAAIAFCFTACGKDKGKDDDGDNHTHTAVKVEGKAPTCTSDGNSEYWACSGCDKLFRDAECKTETSAANHRLAALRHTLEADDGDCMTAIKCSVCGDVVIAASAGHTPEDDGDCTTAAKCSACDTVITEAKSAHVPDDDDGDCTTEIKCSECDVIVVEQKSHVDENVDGACDNCTYEFDYIYEEASNTYYIFTAAGLYEWGNCYYSSSVVLMRDIVMPEELTYDLDGDGENDSNWDPAPSFSNTFDGNGYSISGVIINTPEKNNVAFFDLVAESGIVKDLSLVDISVMGGLRIAGLAGDNHGTIIGCSVSGSIYSYMNDTAGIAGYNRGTIIACHNSADVYSGNGGAGGIVGQLSSSGGNIIGCYNTGKITSNGESIGGIVGSGYGGNIIACFAMGEVDGPYRYGALCGYEDAECYFIECYFIGEEGLDGIGYGSGEPVFRIDGVTLTLADAVAAMNVALVDGGYYWYYVQNEGADADVRPVMILEVEMPEVG